MSVSTHDIALETLDGLTGFEALCLFVGEDERPLRGTSGFVDWRLCGQLSRVLLDGFFVGARNDTLLLPSEGRVPTPCVFAVGLGPTTGFGADALEETLTTAARMLSRAHVSSVAMEVPGHGSLDDATRVDQLLSRFLPKFSGERIAVLAEKPLGKMIQGAKSGAGR